MTFEWMAWTLPTAIFFASIGTMLIAMTALERFWPSVARKGFLPMATTRGDRLFVALLVTAFVHLGWLAVTNAPVVIATGLAAIVFAALLRYG